tara:strand:- start:45234 stop:45653 length:420 start_codon:yes stop_codon:yes gene_type:complete
MYVLQSFATWLVLGVAPTATTTPSVTTRHVDLIELNHYIDEEGREVFQQLVFYDWSKSYKRFHVRAWRLIKHPSQLPQRRWAPTMYQCTWRDEGSIRQVQSPSMRETWTQEDPERANRELLPESQRVPLWDDHPETTSR